MSVVNTTIPVDWTVYRTATGSETHTIVSRGDAIEIFISTDSTVPTADDYGFWVAQGEPYQAVVENGNKIYWRRAVKVTGSATAVTLQD